MPEKSAIYPVTRKQQYMLDLSTHPDCPADLRDRWIIADAILVRPRIDLRRFRRAVGKLEVRHDILRLRFAKKNGVWQAMLPPAGQEMIREVHLGDVDDATFQARIQTLANEPMEMDGGPMAEMLVVNCGARGDVVIARVNHTIADGYGMIVLVEDLIKLLIGLPIIGKAVSFSEYLSNWHSPPPSRRNEVRTFWENLHKSLPKAPNVGRVAKGLPPLVDGMGDLDVRSMVFKATPASFSALQARANRQNVAVSTFLTAGHLEAICRCYDLERLAFTTYIGRSEPGLARFVGDHTFDTVLPYEAVGMDDIASAAIALSHRFGEAMAHLPSDTCCCGTPYYQSLIDAGVFPAQFALYQPRPVARQSKSPFQAAFLAGNDEELRLGPYSLSRIDTNINRRILCELQINVGIGDGEAGFTLNYDSLAYTAEEIRKLGEVNCAMLGLELREAVAA